MTRLALALGGSRRSPDEFLPIDGMGTFGMEGIGYRPDRAIVRRRDRLEDATDIAQKMPSIDHLPCLRSTCPDAFSEDFCAITGDGIDRWMRLQPPCKYVGIPVRKQIDDLVAFEIDDHRAVATAAASCPFIDADNTRCPILGGLHGPNEAKKSIGAGRHGQTMGQSRCGFPTEGKTEMTLDLT
jgi:hypothetical protein